MISFRSYLEENKKDKAQKMAAAKVLINSLQTVAVNRPVTNSKVTYHVRADIGPDPIVVLAGLGYAAKESAEQISGQYTTYDVDVDGTRILFVNQHRITKGGTSALRTKQLTPDKLNLSGTTFPAMKIIHYVDNQLDRITNIDEKMKVFLKNLLRDANQKGTTINIADEVPENISAADLKTISKDYGEILAGIWATKNIGFSQIFFPSAENEPLVDFYGIRGKIKYPVSIKSGGGSATSIKNLTNIIREKHNSPEFMNQFTAKEKELIDVLFFLSDMPVMESILTANMKLNTKGYKALAKIIGTRNINVNVVKNWMENKTHDELEKLLKPLYDVIGNKPKKESWNSRKMKGNEIGFVVGPMGHYLVSELNNRHNLALLTKIASTITLLQLNIDVKKKVMSFKRKKFKQAKFKFSWQGGAPNPNRNRIGFQQL